MEKAHLETNGPTVSGGRLLVTTRATADVPCPGGELVRGGLDEVGSLGVELFSLEHWLEKPCGEYYL